MLLDVSEAAVLAAAIEDLCRRTGRQPSGRLGLIVAKLRKVVANTDGSTTKTVRLFGVQGDSDQHCAYDLVTSGEAARILGISAHGVRDLRRRGVLAGHHTGTRWLYPLRIVEARAERRAAKRTG
ncbi:helix-turn-helix domain-containing protein [Mycobacterium paraffinicum]|uniref:helix-turn-helix domain-containing protein n=1 Tax=Mycobacterium paraffinicum TaxID=53378 RepID=UPI00142E794B|nr:helix-turn-helix domain-containing protein [Mycobacterium paraffinicum]